MVQKIRYIIFLISFGAAYIAYIQGQRTIE